MCSLCQNPRLLCPQEPWGGKRGGWCAGMVLVVLARICEVLAAENAHPTCSASLPTQHGVGVVPAAWFLRSPPPLLGLRLRGSGTHDGKRKKKKKFEAMLAAKASLVVARDAAVTRVKRAKEKEAFRERMVRRRKERDMIEEEDRESSEDDGAGLRYAMSLPEEARLKILDQLRALEPDLPDTDNPANEVGRLTDEELLAGLTPPPQPLPFGLGGRTSQRQRGKASGFAGADSGTGGASRQEGGLHEEGGEGSEEDEEDGNLNAKARRERDKNRKRAEMIEAEEKRFRVPDMPEEEIGGELDIDAILTVFF